MLLTSLCLGLQDVKQAYIACWQCRSFRTFSRILVAELCYYFQKADGGHEKCPYDGQVSTLQEYPMNKAVSRITLRLGQEPLHEQTY